MKLGRVPRKDGALKNASEKYTAPISYERFSYGDLDKSQYETYTLRNVPTDANSPTYRLAVPYFSNGGGEEYILFKRNVEKVWKGQNIQENDFEQKYSMLRRLLQGAALAEFNNVANEYEDEDAEVFELCMRAVRDSAFPKRAATKQRRYLRRFVRKPPNVPIKEHTTRLLELNGYFPEFPPEAEPEEGEEETPPSILPPSDIAEIIEFGCPNSWTRFMRQQDFDPTQKTTAEFIQFLERCEEDESTQEKPSTSSEKKNSKKRGRSETDSTTDKQYYCMLHGKNHTHDTNDCNILKSQAKKMRGMYDAQPKDRKAQYKKNQELNAIVKIAVARALESQEKRRKSRGASSKKRHRADLKAFENLNLSESDHEQNDTDTQSEPSTSSSDNNSDSE